MPRQRLGDIERGFFGAANEEVSLDAVPLQLPSDELNPEEQLLALEEAGRLTLTITRTKNRTTISIDISTEEFP